MKFNTFYQQNTTFHYITTHQFKTRVLTIRFFAALNRENLTARPLMLAILKAKNKALPTRRALSKHLDYLYDALFYGSSYAFGTRHVNQLTMVFIDDAYTLEKRLFDDALQFMKHVLFEPLFDAQTLKEEQRFLHQYFDGEYTNKNRYAHRQFLKNLMKDHPYHAHAYGQKEMIDAVSLDDIQAAYRQMMTEDEVHVTLVGAFDEQSTHSALSQAMPLHSTKRVGELIHRHHFNPIEDIHEQHNVTQTRLFKSYQTDVYYRDKDYFSMVVFATMFGESSDSVLFKTVRETHSLVYYINAGYSPFTGLMTVHCGMDETNKERVNALIETCLDDIASGRFSDEDMSLAKTHLISGFKQTYDSPANLSQKALRASLFNIPLHEEDVIKAIQRVSKQDIIAQAKTLSRVFTYSLGGEQNG